LLRGKGIALRRMRYTKIVEEKCNVVEKKYNIVE